jgi:hypothetical protein
MVRSRARLASLLALLLLAPVSSCEKSSPGTQSPSEDSVDTLTRDLLAAIAEGERERAQSLSAATLSTELDERTVATVGRTLTWLGPIQSLAQTSETPVAGGVERHYRVGFERDELTLTITVVGGKVEGFEFDPDQWEAADDRATEAAAGSLRIAQFGFLGPEGELLPGPADPGNVSYSVALEGLDAQLREHHVTIAKLVVDAEGNQVYKQRDPDEIRFPQAETGSDGGTITGAVAVPGPGSYELELRVTDLVAGKSLEHRVPFEIR